MHIPKPTINRTLLGDVINEAKIAVKYRLDCATGCKGLISMAEQRLGYRPDISAPKTFNEKVNWRKVNDRNPSFPLLADKIRVRDQIRKRLGHELADDLLVELYAVTNKPRTFDFSQLPDAYVAKANHASGWNIFVKPEDPLDEPLMRREMSRWLRRSYGKLKHEWAYQPIPRRVLFEEFVTQPDGRVPDDLKFMFFNGACQFVLWVDDRFGEQAQHFLRPDWTPYDFATLDFAKRAPPPKPAHYNLMLETAQVMAKDIDSVRVDFLFTDDRIILNEMTLYRGSGMTPFNPPEWDRHFGDLWTLPEI